MSDQNEDVGEAPQDAVEDSGPDNFFIDILTGNKESVSAKKLLVQKVLRQLIESYGFDRNDLEVDYKHRIKGGKPSKIDIAIFHPGAEHTNDNLQRIIVCKTQKKRDKLRSIAEAEPDQRELKELLELIPGATLGMWNNGQEEFLFEVERARFEVRQKPLGVWPAPGEGTSDVDRTGGVIQVAADAEGLENDLLHLIVEIKGYRREDARVKKSTMDTYWVPGVNNLGAYGRWAFAEFTEVYQIETDFEAKVEAEFNKMIEQFLSVQEGSS